jgi:hypothetical protein
VTLSVAGETVTIIYYPGRVTEKSMAQIQSMATLDESSIVSGFAGFNETLAHLVKSWDVLDDSVDPPVMFPLEPKRLAELPIGFRIQAMGAIMNDIRPEAMAPQLNGHS